MIIIDDYLNDSILIEIKNDKTFSENLPYKYWEGGYWNNESDGNVKTLISKLFTNTLIDEICNSVTGEGKFYPENYNGCLLYTSPSPRDVEESRMPSSA